MGTLGPNRTTSIHYIVKTTLEYNFFCGTCQMMVGRHMLEQSLSSKRHMFLQLKCAVCSVICREKCGCHLSAEQMDTRRRLLLLLLLLPLQQTQLSREAAAVASFPDLRWTGGVRNSRSLRGPILPPASPASLSKNFQIICKKVMLYTVSVPLVIFFTAWRI